MRFLRTIAPFFSRVYYTGYFEYARFSIRVVTIRLSRAGTKKKPFYHVVVTDSRNKRDGRLIERLGFYNPMATGRDVPIKLDVERINYWLSQGAQTSVRVRKIIKDNASEAA